MTKLLLPAAMAATMMFPVAAEAQQKPAPKPGPGQAQAMLLETSGKWQAFATPAQGAARICYALGTPAERKPANLKDVKGFVFITSRPGQGVRHEISFVMNFDLKEGVEHQALIGETKFSLVAKGQNLWLRNPAEESRLLDAMRRGSALEVKATSKRGNATADRYTLAGIAQTVKKAEDACK
ncbi:MAG: invasion associated locus B family protein [Bosea sp. (in: a-proteobacteria)]